MRFIVRLRMLITEEGGRRTPAKIGYRPDWDWGSGMLCCAIMLSEVPIGLSLDIEIQPLIEENWIEVEVGTKVKVQEGAKVVGYAEVLEILS